MLLACQCSPKQITYCREGKNPLKYSGNERIKKSTCIFLTHHRNNFTDYNVFVYYHYVCLFVCLFPFSGWQNLPITKKLQYVTDKIVVTLLSSYGIPLKNKKIQCHSLSPPFKGGAIFFAVLTIATCTGSLNIHMFKVCRYKH